MYLVSEEYEVYVMYEWPYTVEEGNKSKICWENAWYLFSTSMYMQRHKVSVINIICVMEMILRATTGQ